MYQNESKLKAEVEELKKQLEKEKETVAKKTLNVRQMFGNE